MIMKQFIIYIVNITKINIINTVVIIRKIKIMNRAKIHKQ